MNRSIEPNFAEWIITGCCREPSAAWYSSPKPLGLVEVVLDGRHLPGAADGVAGLHRDLRAVERRAARVGHQLEAGLGGDVLQDRGRLRPLLVGADELVRLGVVAGRQLEVEVVEPEVA